MRFLPHALSIVSKAPTFVLFFKTIYSQELQDALREAQADLDEQRRELNEKKEELQGLKKASSEKEAELLSEVRRLKEQSLRDKAELERAVERAKEVTAHTLGGKARQRPSHRTSDPSTLVCSQERRGPTTVRARSCRKQTPASESGWPAWYITHSCTRVKKSCGTKDEASHTL